MSESETEPRLNRRTTLRYDTGHKMGVGGSGPDPTEEERVDSGRADMEVTGPGSVSSSFPIQQPRSASDRPAAVPQPPSTPQDELEISDVAKKLEALAESGELRQARLAQIKAAIEAGEYETPEKLEAAVDRLLDELLSEE